MKKIIWLLSLIGVVGSFCSIATVQAQNDHGRFGDTEAVGSIGLPWVDRASETGGELITVIKTFINWVLGLLGLIALVLCLYAGFQMTTAAGDSKKFESGTTILKHAAIGLAIIALSWLIVSLIFWVLNGVTTKT